MVTGDLDANGHDEVTLVFPGSGVWIWQDGAWERLHVLDARRLAVGQIDGVAWQDLVLDFQGLGLRTYANRHTWTSLHPLSATTIVTADLDDNGTSSSTSRVTVFTSIATTRAGRRCTRSVRRGSRRATSTATGVRTW